MDSSQNDMENPWTGRNAWREFLWDLRHPILFWNRAWDGIEEAVRFVQRGFRD